MKIAVAQINTTVADFEGNASRIIDSIRWAESCRADVVIFPELTICGYPPRDLVEKPDFVIHNLRVIEDVARSTKDTAAVVGFISINEEAVGRAFFNSAAVLKNGRIDFVQHKTLLPEYDVFDEARHFEPASRYGVCKLQKKKVGLSMCEDIWKGFGYEGRKIYRRDPIEKVVKAGADIVLNLSASPFTIDKHSIRKELVCSAARKFKRPVVYCNLVGGDDELVFDGRSFIVNKDGRLLWEAKCFEEDRFVLDLDSAVPLEEWPEPADEEKIYKALKLGLSDYMSKCGFERVVVGLSGGIDSSLVAAIACDAIGARRVMGVLMPSLYSSKESVDDALSLAKNFGIYTCTVPINEIYEAYRTTLGCRSDPSDLTIAEENIQARVRGNILMAISNREAALVLSTGNKSELSVGYCTLYGDMAGGLALISDLPKTTVYTLSRYINRNGELIPNTIIQKPPSAELKPRQVDSDTLPPYDILDAIIRMYVEDRMSPDEIISRGFEGSLVDRIIRMIDRNEYKRRQAAPGIKITSKAFGFGRRFPIAWKS